MHLKSGLCQSSVRHTGGGGWFHELSEQPIPDTLKVDAPKEALGTGNDGDHQDARPEGQGDWGVGRLSPSRS